jgi:hypothetical protein
LFVHDTLKGYDVLMTITDNNSSTPLLIVKDDYLYLKYPQVYYELEDNHIRPKLNCFKTVGIDNISDINIHQNIHPEKFVIACQYRDILYIKNIFESMFLSNYVFNFYRVGKYDNEEILDNLLSLNVALLESKTIYSTITSTNFPFLYVFKERILNKFPNLDEVTLFVFTKEISEEAILSKSEGNLDLIIDRKVKYVTFDFPTPKNTKFFPLYYSLEQALYNC